MSSESSAVAVARGAEPTVGEPAIRVRGVAKRYRIWASPSARIRAFAAEAAAMLVPEHSRARVRLLGRAATCYHDFEALQDINFVITPGEAVGIIGRNGSGKSTLLQIIAGTLLPSAGEVEVRGKVAALLELGSAFHPQFTGRENVYLYCSILGVPASRVEDLFEEIAAFADIGEYLDQPVKTYSSGMMLRLAFAVQTAITPEVLIVDEALAVGDTFFQARCMRRIRRMLDDGATLLFVSHAMSTVREVCTRGIVLDHGRMVFDGEISKATRRYLTVQVASTANVEAERGNIEPSGTTATLSAERAQQSAQSAVFKTALMTDEQLVADELDNNPGPEEGKALFERKAAEERLVGGRSRFYNVQMLDQRMRLSDSYSFGEPVILRMYVDVEEVVPYLFIAYTIRTVSGTDAVHGNTNLLEALDYV